MKPLMAMLSWKKDRRISFAAGRRSVAGWHFQGNGWYSFHIA
jgi:hypothetical protein